MSVNRILHFQDLVLEVTRKCNMSCAHCMRGEPENINLQFSQIKPLFDCIEGIDTLTFSGGEPTLNINVMQDILDYCKKHNLPIYNFYIVTNGKTIPDEFIMFLTHLYAYCRLHNPDVKDYSGIALSQDDFHESIPDNNKAILESFVCYRPEDKKTDFTQTSIIPIGRAKQLSPNDYKIASKLDMYYRTKEPDISKFHNIFYIDECECYVTANGKIMFDCNQSYEQEDMTAKHTCKNIPAFLQALENKTNEN